MSHRLKNFNILWIGMTVMFCTCSFSSNTDNSPYNISDASITEGSTEMYYSLAVRKNYDADEVPVVLVLALHYGGETHSQFGREFLDAVILPAYEKLRCIVVAPVAPLESGWANATTDKIVMKLMAQIQDEYNIDPERILVTGYSLGGIGTWYFAAKHPDYFTAAIPMSGSIPGNVNPIDALPPTYVIHSSTDEVFPFEDVEEAVQNLKDKKLNVRLKVVDSVSHYNTPGFVIYLEDTIEWLSQIWM